MEQKIQGLSQIYSCNWAKAHFPISNHGPSAKAEGNERKKILAYREFLPMFFRFMPTVPNNPKVNIFKQTAPAGEIFFHH